MSDIVYRIRDESLYHASFSSFRSSLSSGYRARKQAQAERRERNGSPTQHVVGRTHLTRNPYGNYKSVYYDPVARHERYMREKTSTASSAGTASASGSGGSGKGRGGGGGGKGSGKGRGGSGRGGGQNVSNAIAKLREESMLDTEAQREATKRKIEDLREQLKKHLEKLSSLKKDDESSANVLEIRGKIQELKDQIEAAGLDLQKWMDDERKSLQRRIASLTGQTYEDTTEADKQTLAKRQKEINSRADEIYKRRSDK